MNHSRKEIQVAGKPHQRRHPLQPGGARITTFVPLVFKRRGLQRVVVAPDGVANPVSVTPLEAAIPKCHDPTLLKALGRGYYWQHLLDSGAMRDAAEIADREGLHKVTVNDTIRFALMAPDLVKAGLEGRLPRTFTLETLQRESPPLDWDQQRRWVGAVG